jgi:hypothetical protein
VYCKHTKFLSSNYLCIKWTKKIENLGVNTRNDLPPTLLRVGDDGDWDDVEGIHVIADDLLDYDDWQYDDWQYDDWQYDDWQYRSSSNVSTRALAACRHSMRV